MAAVNATKGQDRNIEGSIIVKEMITVQDFRVAKDEDSVSSHPPICPAEVKDPILAASL